MAAITPVGVKLVVQNFGQFAIQMNQVGASLTRLGGMGRVVSAGFSLMNAAMRVAITVAGATVAAIAGVTFAIGRLAKDAVVEANNFETAYAGMLKTVAELTDPATNEINELGETVKQQFRDMAKEIPVAFEELARIGTIAGQMDIPAKALAGFTEAIAAITVSTDLAADEATENFATIAKIFQVSEDDMVNWAGMFGSALVQLGNNFAVTEPEILRFAERIAGAGAALGLTERDIIAIGAAFGQSGVQMQRGGTAVQKVLIKMNEAMQEGGDALDKIANVAMPGFTNATEEFIKLDPAEQFRRFTEGLARQGPEAIQILKELELGDQRLLGAFLNVSSAQGELTRAMEASEDAFWANTALTREASIFYGTFANQVELAKNRVRDLKVTLGEEIKTHFLQPLLADALDFLEEIEPKLQEAFSYIGPALEEHLLPSLGELAEAIFGEVDWENLGQSLGESFEKGIGNLSTFISNLASDIEWAKTKMEELRTSISDFRTDISNLSTAFSEGGFSGGLAEMFDIPTEKAETIEKWAKGIAIFIGVVAAIAGAIALVAAIPAALAAIAAAIETIYVTVGVAILSIIAFITSPITLLVAAIAAFVAILVTNWETISTAFKQLGFIIAYYAKYIWNKIKIFFTEKIPEAFENFKESISNVWEGFKEKVTNAWDDIKEAVSTKIEELKQAITDKLAEIGEAIRNKWNEILEWFGFDEELKEQWRQNFEDLGLIAAELWERLKNTVSEKWEAIKEYLVEIWETIKTRAIEAWESTKTAIVDTWDRVKESFIEKWETIKTWLIEKWEDIKTTASDIWTGIKDHVVEIWNQVIEPLQRVWDTVKESFLESWEGIKAGFEEKKSAFMTKVEEFKTSVKDALDKMWSSMKQVGKDIIDGILEGLKSTRHKIISWITGLATSIIQAVKDALGIQSPSSEFAKIGKYMVDGLSKGIKKHKERYIKSMKETSKKIPSVAKRQVTKTNNVDNSKTVTVNANYTETQSPGTIADDLAILSLYGI